MTYTRRIQTNKVNILSTFGGILVNYGAAVKVTKTAVFIMHKNQQFKNLNNNKK